MKYDLIIIGAGPAGEVGAIRAAQLGMKVALIEKRKHLGGTCLNVGCIPTKALLQSATVYDKAKNLAEEGVDFSGAPKLNWDAVQKKKNGIVDQQRKGLRFLMKKNKIETFEATATFTKDKKVKLSTGETLEAEHILIATGSKVRDFPFAKVDHKMILTSDSIMDIPTPPKSLAVIGGGVVGCEFASMFSRFDVDVTVIELADSIIPFEDAESSKELSRYFKKTGIKVLTKAQVEKVTAQDDQVEVKLKDQTLKFEKVLMSIGRVPVTEELKVAEIGLDTDERGFIKVGTDFKTNVDGVYAVGDVIATPALAHTASAEAKWLVEAIAGHGKRPINYLHNPNAIYTYPEVASLGKTEEKLKEDGTEYSVAKFPFAPMAKAKIDGSTVGFVKILYGKKYQEILGVHLVHAKATEMIAEFVLGQTLEMTMDELSESIHPHPTLSETIMEAAHMAEGGAIHL